MNTLTDFINFNFSLQHDLELPRKDEADVNARGSLYEIIENEVLKNSDLRGLIISGSLFSLTTFKKVTFESCVFQASRWENCEFVDCNFINCTFEFCHIAYCNFRGSSFYNCKWDISPLTKNSFTYCGFDPKTEYFASKSRSNQMLNCFSTEGKQVQVTAGESLLLLALRKLAA